MQTLPDSISEKIFQIDPLIRFVGIYKNNELRYAYRKDIMPYIDINKTKKSFELAAKRWEERKELLSSEIGNPIYSLTMYETVKRIIMEFEDGSLILLSTELEIDHEKLLSDLMNYSDSITTSKAIEDCQGIVIDDDPDAVDSISESLELKGICVIGRGYNGEDAYQLFKMLHPKFVILDMKMPEYDGVYAIKKIKDEDPNAKIIVLTAYANYEFDRNEVTAVMSKPFKMKEVLNVIEEIC